MVRAQVNYLCLPSLSSIFSLQRRELSTAGHSPVVCLRRCPRKVQGSTMEWEAEEQWRKKITEEEEVIKELRRQEY